MNCGFQGVDMGHISNEFEERLSRKMRLLLEQNKGQSLFSILFTKSSIKDEYVALDRLDNKRLEYHIDKALRH